MSDKYYSFASIQGGRVPALYAALLATVTHDKAQVRIGFNWLEPEEVDAALRAPAGIPLPFGFALRRSGDNVAVTIDRIFTVLSVVVDAPTDEEEGRVHALIADTLGLEPPSSDELRGVATAANMNELLWKIHDKLVVVQL